MKSIAVLLLTCFLCSPTVAQENWPQWRGPTGNGVAADAEYPSSFSNTKSVIWKSPLPGRGSSTPAVWGEQIFVTCGIDGEDGVLCFDFDGTEQWRQKLGKETAGKHRNASGSNASPVATAQFVVVYYKSGTVACLNHAGKIQWQKNVVSDYGKDTLWWDRATSPVIAAGNAVVAVMQDEDSYLVAFDLATGKVAWKQPRNLDAPGEANHAYTTPSVIKQNGRETIVCWGADHLTGHDAKSGEELWQRGGFNPDQTSNWRAIASAAVDDTVAIVPYGRGDFLAAIDMSTKPAPPNNSAQLWEQQGVAADVPTPLIHGDHVIVLTDKGRVACFDKSSGVEEWKAELPKGRSKYFASPVLAGNTLYFAREDGVIMSAIVADGLEQIIENHMKEATIATPVPIRGGLLVRGEKHLFWIKGE